MLPPASGTGIFTFNSPKVIRLLRKGCTNRPFYHIVIAVNRQHQSRPVIEQLGSFDPLPNQYNEKLVALNLERIRYWIGNGAMLSKPVEQVLGLAGLFPIHPTSFMQAWRNRQVLEAQTAKQAEIIEAEPKTENISQ